tara:strand:- start:47 stop:865 length:819 start_codon:yes stop_codon:yes gene_type:complete
VKKVIKKIINRIKRFFKYRKSVSDNGEYPKFCRDASKDEEIFQTFRVNPQYMKILEHVSEDLAKKYFYNIKESFGLSNKEIYEICKKLDNPGSPKLMKIVDNMPFISASALRYLSTGLQIDKLVKNKNLNNVIEIGAGYGGQAIILNDILKIDNYTFVDLKDVNLLIKKFTSHFDLNFQSKFLTLDDKFEKEYDLVISNYSFSELPRRLQDVALNKIILNSSRGFMIMNSDSFNKNYNFYSKKEILEKIPSSKAELEIPNTNLNEENFTLTF